MNVADVERLVDAIDYFTSSGMPPATIACLRTTCGHVVVGMSVPARTDSYDPEIGRKLARDSCIRQLIEAERFHQRRRAEGRAP